MVDWPESLPQHLRITNFKETMPNNMISSSIDVGIGKRRKRYSAAIRPIEGTLDLDATQVQVLDDFYQLSLGGGVLRFDWTNPITGVPAEFRFKGDSPPDISANGPVNFIATVKLEQLP